MKPDPNVVNRNLEFLGKKLQSYVDDKLIGSFAAIMGKPGHYKECPAVSGNFFYDGHGNILDLEPGGQKPEGEIYRGFFTLVQLEPEENPYHLRLIGGKVDENSPEEAKINLLKTGLRYNKGSSILRRILGV